MASELQRQAGLTLDLAAAQAELDRQRIASDAARAAEAEWLRTAEEIERSLTDALMRGFEGGKGFAENFRDTLKNMINTLVLRPVVQALVQPVAGQIAGGFGFGGAINPIAQAGGGGFSPTSLLTQSAGLISGVASMAAGTALGSFGAGLASGLASWSMAGASVAGTASAGIATGGAVGAGMALGAAIPVIGGVLALASLFGNSGERFERMVGSASGSLSGGRYTSTGTNPDWFSGAKQFGPEMNQSLDKINQQFLGVVGSLLDAFDIEAELGATTNTRLRRTSGRLVGSLMGSIDGQAFSAGGQYGGDAEIEQSMQQFVTDVMTKGIAAAVQASPLADNIKGIFEGVLDVESTDFAVGNLIALAQFESALARLPTLFDKLTPAVDEALAASNFDDFSDLALFFQQMQAATSAFYDAIVPEAERISFATKLFTAQIGDLDVALPRSASEFRALVESIDTTTQAGRELFASLTALGPAFVEIQQAWRAMLEEVGISTQGLTATLRDVMLGRTDAADAGDALADMVLGGIYNALAGNFASQLTDLMTNTIIMPVVQAAVTGASVADAVSGAAIANMIAAANAAAEQLNQILNNAELQAAMAQVGDAVRSVTGSFGGYAKPYTPPVRVVSAPAPRASSSSANRAWDDAYSALMRAAQVQRDLAIEQLNTAQAVMDMSRTAANELRQVSDASVMMSADAARVAIDNALGALRNTGYLPDPDELRSAIDAARGGMDRTLYGSAFDRQRDALVLAGKLAEIADLAEPQKTAAEEQLERLDSLLDTAREQLDALKGNTVATLSMADAIANWARVTGRTLPAVSSVAIAEPLGGTSAGAMPVVLRMSNSGEAALLAEFAALRREVSELRASSSASAFASDKTARLLDRVTQGGQAMLTEAA